MPALARVAMVLALPAMRAVRGSFTAKSLSAVRQREAGRHGAGLDQAVDVGRAARVEEHVALADRGLLGEQPGVEQGLAYGLRERTVVPREPAREVREVRVVSAPLAHPVEPLEDPAGDAPGRIRILVRRDAAAPARVQQ